MSKVELIVKDRIINMIKSMVHENLINSEDLYQFIPKDINRYDPEFIRQEWEEWYRILGIEQFIHKDFHLKKTYFTREEIKNAYENNEILFCVPGGINRKILAGIFNLNCWAIDDDLVTDCTEIEDFWFTTKATFIPDLLDKTGTEIKRVIENEKRLGMSLERYLVFIARMRYLTGKTPDTEHKVWLTKSRYEGKAFLITGFDSHQKLNVHAWLPQFHSPFCGARSIHIVDHLYE